MYGFEKVNKKSIVKKVRYIDEANEVLSKIQKLNHELAKDNIKFRFRILDNNSLFVKPRDFEIEKSIVFLSLQRNRMDGIVLVIL